MSDIFISYAREDRPKAQQLTDALEGLGWGVWWDVVIPAGKKFGNVIAEKLSQADVIIVLWSAISVNKDWVLDEAQIGRKRNILIPVFIESVDPPLGFGQIHAANLVGWDGSANAKGFLRLVQDISEIIGPSPVSQQFARNPKIDEEASMKGVTDPEHPAQATLSVATHIPVEIKIPQRMVNLPVLSAKIRRNIVLVILVALVFVFAGWYLLLRSSDYAQGVKLFETEQYAEAYPLLLNAADKGNANAQLYVGIMYAYGRGVSENHEEAVKWYRKSAEQGNAYGQCNLGVMYEFGQGVGLSKEEAVKWYRKSAEQGNDWGEYNLGDMLEHGRGVKQNKDQAIKLYRLSAKQGNEKAQQSLKRLGETW